MSERPAIQDCISRYTDAVNRRDWAVFPTIFAADARWQAIGMDIAFDGLEAITRGLSGIVDAMSLFVQMNTPAVIDIDGDRATARSTIYEFGDNQAQGTRFEAYGRYEDELVARDGRWMFTSRRFVRILRKEGPIEV
jgi:ketosteroid isomerase-like protein